MEKNEAQIVESLIRRIDAQRAKIKRAEWAIETTRTETLNRKAAALSPEEEKIYGAILGTIDFIEKCMEG